MVPTAETEALDGPPAQRIPLRRLPQSGPRAGVLAAIALCSGLGAFAADQFWVAGGGLAFGLLIAALLLGYRAFQQWRLETTRPELELSQHAIYAPASPHTARHVRLRYAQIDAVSVYSAGGTRWLVLSSPTQQLALASTQLGGIDALRQVGDYVLHKIRSLPEGPSRHRDFALQERVAHLSVSRRPWVTQSLLGFMLALFAVEWHSGALDNPMEMIRLGANVPALVAHGELYRLVSANFLHAHLLHLVINGWSLLMVGALVERIVGWQRMLSIFLVAALCGAALSAVWARSSFSLGSSTGLFGLIAALGWLQWRRSTTFPAIFRQSARWWLLIIAINAPLSFAVTQIDGAAHLGGAIGGIVATALLVPRHASLLELRPPFWVQLVCVAWVGLTLAGLANALDVARKPAEQTARAHMNAVLAWERTTPEFLNAVAWSVAIEPGSPQDALQMALDAAERAVKQEPEQHMYRDTLATLLHRHGRCERATNEQLTVLAAAGDAFTATQLLRFSMPCAERKACTGFVASTESWPNLTIAVPSGPTPILVGVAYGEGGEVLGLWQGTVDPTALENQRAVLLGDGGELPATTKLLPLCALEAPTTRPEDVGHLAEKGTWTIFPLDRQALELP